MLELAILGLLKEQDLHGYELKKRLSETLGVRAAAFRSGRLYPALARLEPAGAVKAVEASELGRAGIPMTGSLGGELAAFRARRRATPGAAAGRKVYGITDRGQALFEELLAAGEPVDRGRPAVQPAAGVRPLPPADARLGMLERRRARWSSGWSTSAPDQGRPDAGDGYARSLMEHDQRPPSTTFMDRASDRVGATGAQDIARLDLSRPRAPAPPPTGPAPPHQEELTSNEQQIRVAIAGVGNCASSLVQGIEYYRDADPAEPVPGLMHVTSAATTSATSSSWPPSTSTPPRSASTSARPSSPGRTTPSASPRSATSASPCSGARPSTAWASTTARRSRSRRSSRSTWPPCCGDTEADVLVSYLPVGSEEAQKHYAQCLPGRQVAFVNAIPVFIASDPVWAQSSTDAGVPIVGDDIKSQVGATIVHRILARLFEDRGMVLDRTYQLNVGGNMDFKNMLERERLESKKISKTQSVTSQIDNGIAADDVHIGPSDHVPWLDDRKWAYIRLEGRNFGDVPAQRGAQARGVGLPQLGRGDHRRRALRQAGHRPGHRRPAASARRPTS